MRPNPCLAIRNFRIVNTVRIRVFATSRYERQAKKASGGSGDSHYGNCDRGRPVVPATGGVRKARWGRAGKGKSGGVRVIYYYFLRDGEIYMLSVYAKNEQADMSADDKKAARNFVGALKNAKR
jgi:hypothetical protein